MSFARMREWWRKRREARYRRDLLTQCWLNIGETLLRASQHGILLDEITGEFSSIYSKKGAADGVAYIQQEYDYQQDRIARINWLYVRGHTLKGI